ncbi:MAG: HEAT repeat domain-containing protein [Myxococcales bacterium]|nr:MAG: HEAT repeat domain-containing protein [Myxococcales bacterium]
MDTQSLLESIYEADRRADAAETQLLDQSDTKQLASVLSEEVSKACQLADRDEAERRLRRLSDLCAQCPSNATIDALFQILDEESSNLRTIACEALLDLSYERYGEVARRIEARIATNHKGHSMQELPFIIAEVGEASALSLISQFLKHPDSETVAAAIEALASLGEPGAEPALQALAQDPRAVTLYDDDEELTTTIGDLASEALSLISPDEDLS